MHMSNVYVLTYMCMHMCVGICVVHAMHTYACIHTVHSYACTMHDMGSRAQHVIFIRIFLICAGQGMCFRSHFSCARNFLYVQVRGLNFSAAGVFYRRLGIPLTHVPVNPSSRVAPRVPQYA